MEPANTLEEPNPSNEEQTTMAYIFADEKLSDDIVKKACEDCSEILFEIVSISWENMKTRNNQFVGTIFFERALSHPKESMSFTVPYDGGTFQVIPCDPDEFKSVFLQSLSEKNAKDLIKWLSKMKVIKVDEAKVAHAFFAKAHSELRSAKAQRTKAVTDLLTKFISFTGIEIGNNMLHQLREKYTDDFNTIIDYLSKNTGREAAEFEELFDLNVVKSLGVCIVVISDICVAVNDLIQLTNIKKEFEEHVCGVKVSLKFILETIDKIISCLNNKAYISFHQLVKHLCFQLQEVINLIDKTAVQIEEHLKIIDETRAIRRGTFILSLLNLGFNIGEIISMTKNLDWSNINVLNHIPISTWIKSVEATLNFSSCIVNGVYVYRASPLRVRMLNAIKHLKMCSDTTHILYNQAVEHKKMVDVQEDESNKFFDASITTKQFVDNIIYHKGQQVDLEFVKHLEEFSNKAIVEGYTNASWFKKMEDPKLRKLGAKASLIDCIHEFRTEKIVVVVSENCSNWLDIYKGYSEEFHKLVVGFDKIEEVPWFHVFL